MDRKTRRTFAIVSAAEHAAWIELLGDPKISARWIKLFERWRKRFESIPIGNAKKKRRKTD